MKTVSERRLTRWNRPVPPAAQVLRHALQMEGLSVLQWTDPPGTIYPVHTHPFVQVRVILGGHLRIGLPETAEEIILGPGDRLDLPPDTRTGKIQTEIKRRPISRQPASMVTTRTRITVPPNPPDTANRK